MSALDVRGVARYYGDRPVLSGVTFTLAGGDRAGLVGPNGSGKTTLLRILAGLDLPDQGSIRIPASSSVGLLCQDLDLPRGLSLWQLARGAFDNVLDMGRRLTELEAQMAGAGDDAGLLHRYGQLRERFELAGGYEWETTASSVLGGLGFSPADRDRSLDSMSGGEQIRAALARLLLDEPDLLLLDEPTNHLDWDALAWLEAFLARYRGTVLVVSHDRYFLDRAVGRVLALEGGRVQAYVGGYSAYRRQRTERAERAGREAARLQGERQNLKDYILRYKAGNRARQAKSREKRLEKLDRQGLESAPPAPDSAVRLAMETRSSSGREVLHLEGVGHAYGDRVLFTGVTGLVRRGQRLGLVGPNGAGKSTLLRIMAGLMTPSQGRVRLGAGVIPAYLGQDLGLEDEGRVLWDELAREFGLTIPQARHRLAALGFRGDDYQQRIGDLSGGERTRLILGKAAMSGANLLLLDEPTNHLDIGARQALEDALEGYDGTVIAVSHDRALLDRLATRLLSFDGDGGVAWFEGRFGEWIQMRRGPAPAGPRSSGRPGAGPVTDRDRERAARELEAEILRLSEDKDRLDLQLADPDTYRDGGGADVVRQHRQTVDRLAELYRRWEREIE